MLEEGDASLKLPLYAHKGGWFLHQQIKIKEVAQLELNLRSLPILLSYFSFDLPRSYFMVCYFCSNQPCCSESIAQSQATLFLSKSFYSRASLRATQSQWVCRWTLSRCGGVSLLTSSFLELVALVGLSINIVQIIGSAGLNSDKFVIMNPRINPRRRRPDEKDQQQTQLTSEETLPKENKPIHKSLVDRKPSENVKIREEDLPRPHRSQLDSISPKSYDQPNSPDDLFVPGTMPNPPPTFIRSTLSRIFEDPSATKAAQIPIGVIIQPLNYGQVSRYQVSKPERCPQCMAYLNFLFKIQHEKAQCNLCGHAFQRSGQLFPQEPIYDIVIKGATEYNRKNPQRINYLVCMQTGFKWNSTVFQALRASLPYMGSNVLVGFLLYDQQIWTVRKLKNGYFQKIELPNYDSFFLPIDQHQLFWSPSINSSQLDSLISWLSQESQKGNPKQPTGFGSVLRCASKAFQKSTGKILLFAGSPPTQGFGKIPIRSKQLLRKPFASQGKDYQNLGEKLLSQRVMVDSYFFGNEVNRYFDLSTHHFLNSLTGGSVSYFPYYTEQFCSNKLYYQLFHNLTRQVAFDLEFTCRTSTGLSVNEILTSAGSCEERDSAFGGMDSQKTVTVLLQQQQKGLTPSLQFAMLYSNTSGQRVIRVINYSFKVVKSQGQFYGGVDSLTVAVVIARKLAVSLFKNQLQKVADELRVKLQNILFSYKSSKVNNPRLDILQMDPVMHPLPLFIFAIKKSPVFTTESVNPDIRILQYLRLMNQGFLYLHLHFYPRVYRLDNIGKCKYAGFDLQGRVALPETQPCNGYLLSKTAIYLFDTYDVLFLLIGQKSLLGVRQVGQLPTGSSEIVSLGTEESQRVEALIGAIRSRNSPYPPVIFITTQYKQYYKQRLKYLLKEEADSSTGSFSDFLGQVHRNVTNRK